MGIFLSMGIPFIIFVLCLINFLIYKYIREEIRTGCDWGVLILTILFILVPVEFMVLGLFFPQ